MTREEFLVESALVEDYDALERLMQAFGDSDPVWLTSLDADVAWHCLWLQQVLASDQRARLEALDAQKADRSEVEALRAEVDTWGVLLEDQAATIAALVAENDDLRAQLYLAHRKAGLRGEEDSA